MDLIAIKDRAWEQFCKLPGVHAVGIGSKVTGGIRSEETALVVFVERKRPLEELDHDARIPAIFEGVQTDVVQRAVPRLLAAPSITVTEQSLANGKRFTFTATVDPPPIGFMIVLTTTVAKVGGTAESNVVNAMSNGKQNLAVLVSLLETPFNFLGDDAGMNATASAGPPPTFDFTAKAGNVVTAVCYVVSLDQQRYTSDYLRGGIRIQSGQVNEAGTLGCIAVTAPTAQDPQGKVVGVTCSHVLRLPKSAPTGLLLRRPKEHKDTLEIFRQSHVPLPANSIAFVAFLRGANELLGTAFYTASEEESLASIATGLANAIIVAGVGLGISATVASSSADLATLKVTGLGPNEYFQCDSAGPAQPALPLQLVARVEKPALFQNVLVFGGTVPTENYGVFVNINPGGAAQTFGVFHNPPEKQALQALAKDVAKLIGDLPATLRGAVTAVPTESKVTIANAEQVDVWVQTDIQVGQPDDSFGSRCSRCCSHRIGRVVAARPDVDIGLVQFDAGLKYKRHVEGLNLVLGTLPPTENLNVRMRGYVSGLVSGRVSQVGTSGYLAEKSGSGRFTHIYRNAAVVESTMIEPDGVTRRPFGVGGDSGSAVVTHDAGTPRVVGVMFGGATDFTGLIVPVDDVVDAFSSFGLSFAASPGLDPDAVQTVPESAVAFEAPGEGAPGEIRGLIPAAPLAALSSELSAVEEEIAASGAGRQYAEIVRRHFPEALSLVNQNRRVATVWHRSGGPELLGALWRVLQLRDDRLPREINGRPLAECLARLQRIFMRYASPDFARDLADYGARFIAFSGMTYPQLLTELRSGSTE